MVPWRNRSLRHSSDSRGCRTRDLRLQRGQSLLEVALLTPLLVAMVLGAIEIGRYAFLSILVGNAARAGAAYGAQSLAQSATPANQTVNPGILQAADNDFQNNGQDITKLSVSSSQTCGCDNGGAFISLSCNSDPTTACPGTNNHWIVLVSVTTSGTFQALFHYPWIPPSITVTRTCTLRVKQQ